MVTWRADKAQRPRAPMWATYQNGRMLDTNGAAKRASGPGAIILQEVTYRKKPGSGTTEGATDRVCAEKSRERRGNPCRAIYDRPRKGWSAMVSAIQGKPDAFILA